jgi:CarD family transcriptional regulator, regulator of rRNA transcription
MKVSARTATKGHEATASRRPAPSNAAPARAKPAQTAAAAKKTAPVKAAKETEKPVAPRPEPKAAAASKAPVAKAAPPKPESRPALAAVAPPERVVKPNPTPPTEAVAEAPPPAAPTVDRRPPIPDRIPPRPPAKAEVFVEGDHVVYPTHGVGKVERIAIEEIAGHKLELIHITFEENRMTLRVPVAKARSAGLRKLATRKLFDEALGVLKGRARIKRTMWSRRAQEYEAKINSGDPLAIAEVVRDLHRNAGQPDQSFSERQIYEAAMDRLAAELAALDKTDKMTAATKLTNFLKTV